jgi:hypothetical protein
MMIANVKLTFQMATPSMLKSPLQTGLERCTLKIWHMWEMVGDVLFSPLEGSCRIVFG